METLPDATKMVRKRWLRFSLRSLLILMLLVAAFCGGWVSHARWTHVDREEQLQQALLDSIHESFRASIAAQAHAGAEGDLDIVTSGSLRGRGP
jgi:hypothetical protein